MPVADGVVGAPLLDQVDFWWSVASLGSWMGLGSLVAGAPWRYGVDTSGKI